MPAPASDHGVSELARVQVTGLRQIGGGVYSLRFGRTFGFEPGECVPVAASDRAEPRRYSLASSPRDPEAELLFDLVVDGELTPRLARAQRGDALWVGPPAGSFRDGLDPAVWIAAGTGVAPFLSMARAGRFRDRTLIHGSRTLDGLLYGDELRTALGPRYVPCCPAEPASGVFAGRLTAYLASVRLEPAVRYLLCGSPSMVVDVRDLLIARGVPFGHILSEIYF